jgi:hypothetical protein
VPVVCTPRAEVVPSIPDRNVNRGELFLFVMTIVFSIAPCEVGSSPILPFILVPMKNGVGGLKSGLLSGQETRKELSMSSLRHHDYSHE